MKFNYPNEAVMEKQTDEPCASSTVVANGALHRFPHNRFRIWAGIAVVVDTETRIRSRAWARRINRWV
jgi:hypothetical protein